MQNITETPLEVRDVIDMSGVESQGENVKILTNFRMYGSRGRYCRNAIPTSVGYVR